MAGKGRVGQALNRDAVGEQGLGRGHHVRQEPAAHLEAIQLAQLVIRVDGPELQDLVEAGVQSGGLGVPKHEAHRQSSGRAVTQTGCRGVIVDVKGGATQFPGQEKIGHQQLGGKQVGLDLHGVDARRGHGVAHQHRERLVYVHLTCHLVAMQHQVAALVCHGEALAVRVVQGVDADNGGAVLDERHPRQLVVER